MSKQPNQDKSSKTEKPLNIPEGLDARRQELEQRLRQDLDKLDDLRREVEQRLTQEVVQLVAASGHSMRGLKFAVFNERAFRLEVILSCVFIPLAFVLGNSFTDTALLLVVIGLVLVTELLNSAIEATVDRISLEHHELSGRAKDLGSAAVWISLVFAGVVWGLKLLSLVF